MTRRSPEGAFSIRDGIPRMPPRVAGIVVSAHTIRGDSAATLHRAEATALDTIGARPDTPGVTVEWAIHTRRPVTSSDDNPDGGQPAGSTMRHPWQPGQPLPPHSLYATCTATRDAAG